jgi:hypothetical protein
VIILGDGSLKVGGVALRRAETRASGALEHAPAVIAAARDDVDLLAHALSHVARVQLAGDAVEGEAEGVAQADGVNLVAARRRPEERVVGGR